MVTAKQYVQHLMHRRPWSLNVYENIFLCRIAININFLLQWMKVQRKNLMAKSKSILKLFVCVCVDTTLLTLFTITSPKCTKISQNFYTTDEQRTFIGILALWNELEGVLFILLSNKIPFNVVKLWYTKTT